MLLFRVFVPVCFVAMFCDCFRFLFTVYLRSDPNGPPTAFLLFKPQCTYCGCPCRDPLGRPPMRRQEGIGDKAPTAFNNNDNLQLFKLVLFNFNTQIGPVLRCGFQLPSIELLGHDCHGFVVVGQGRR